MRCLPVGRQKQAHDSKTTRHNAPSRYPRARLKLRLRIKDSTSFSGRTASANQAFAGRLRGCTGKIAVNHGKLWLAVSSSGAEQSGVGRREGSAVRWHRGGEGNMSPGFPPSHTYRYFFLHLRDLVDLSPESTSDIALEIRRQMLGGFDLEAIASNLFPPVKQRRRPPRTGQIQQCLQPGPKSHGRSIGTPTPRGSA